MNNFAYFVDWKNIAMADHISQNIWSVKIVLCTYTHNENYCKMPVGLTAHQNVE